MERRNRMKNTLVGKPFRHRFLVLALGPVVLAALAWAALTALSGCNGDETSDKPSGSSTAPPPLARVATQALPYEVRLPGETAFTSRSGLQDLQAGTTIRTKGSLIALNVVQAVQVQLFPGSELLLIGWEERPEGECLILALQDGEAGIRTSLPDRPVVLETPAASVIGRQPQFSAKVSFGEDNLFHLTVLAMSRGIALSNEKGTVTIPIRGRGYASETAAPQILR